MGAQLISSDSPGGVPPGPPWYFRAISGCGAWLACMFLMVFWAMLSSGPAHVSTIGVIHTAAALALAHKANRSPSKSWLSNLGLALWFTGLALILIAVSDSSIPLPHFTMHTVILAGASLLYPEWLGRLLTMVLTGVMATANLCHSDSALPPDLYLVILPVVTGACWLAQRRLWLTSGGNSGQARAGFCSAVGYASVVTLWLILAASYWKWSHLPLSNAGRLSLMVMVLWLTARVVYRLRLPSAQGAWALGGTLIVALISHQVPGVLAGLGVLLLGFEARSRGLMVLAGFFWAVFIPTYFYSLEVALTPKSFILLATGAILLGLRWSLFRR